MGSEEVNDFEDIDMDNDLPPTSSANDMMSSGDTMIDSGGSGEKYDWNTAPEKVRAPPRVNLNGMEVTIEKADIILPPIDREWTKGKDNKKVEYKYCTFVLFYNKDGQQEFFSGVRVFKRDVDNNEKYSHPSIMTNRKNQASKLLGLYADYKQKNINEVSLKEFMAFLNSKPKAIIKVETVTNPTTDETIEKNLIEKFI